MRPTLRLKLFAALALVAVLGASGGMLSLLRLHHLGRAYQSEQLEVAAHEAVHEDRIALLSLLTFIDRHRERLPPEDAELGKPLEARLQQLVTSAVGCAACHSDLQEHREFAAQLAELRQELAAMFTPGAAAGSAPAVEASILALEHSRAIMEERFHELLERRRAAGSTALPPSLAQQLALVGGGLVGALFLAWLMARAMSRSTLPLIAAARRLASGAGGPASVSRDPDLAQVTVALNEMAALVAQQAREDARRQLLDRTIASQEEERKRVARELHDTLGQSLSALLMEIKTHHGRDEGQAEGIAAQVARLLAEVHRIAWDLRPSLLDDLGLQSALSRFAEETAKRHHLPIDFQAVGFAGEHARLSGQVETVLYRVAQEAISNIARHARAKRASVVLVRRDGEVALLVEDDGSGFDVETIRRDRASLGLLGMEERVALVGGNLTIVSALGQGTSVRATIPSLAVGP